MARKATGRPNGRPPREFDQKLFENLCFVNCTVNEMECILSCDQRTLDVWCQRTYGERYSTVYKRFSENGKSSVRRNQLNLSKTNASMAIWLGKVWLGQKDPVEELNTKRIVGALEQIQKLKILNDDQQQPGNDNPNPVQEAGGQPVLGEKTV